uniref:Chromatin modification-related protein MEAF6 n=1 Tax=Lotharella oceanica TaxID=641309 RepID=A0A7S2XBB0_9EUKA
MDAKKSKSYGAGMKALLQRRAQIEEDLKNVERQIFDLEENYICDTNHYGNVIKGWEGYNNAKPKQMHAIRKTKINEKDRIFSESSTTAPKHVDDDMDDASNDVRPQRMRRASTSTRNKNFSYSDDDADWGD